jgi:hypothetical protein
MSKLSLLDKLSLFIDVAKDSIWSILILLILLVLLYLFSNTTKKTIKRNKIIYIGFSLLILIILLISYLPSINKIFDNMMNNLFIIIYFPNLAVYFAAIIATSIILWISIFNYKTTEIIRKLNLVIYLIINYLFLLLLYTIKNNKLDIFSIESVYGNKQATALIELSSIIFVVWVLFLIVYKLILIYLRRDYRPKVKKVIVKEKVKKLPENYLNIDIPSIVYSSKPSINTKPYIEIKAPEVVYGTIPKKNIVDNRLKVYEDMLTLEDYKLLLKLLKEQKKTKKEVKEEKFIQPNFTELENLYRSIR